MKPFFEEKAVDDDGNLIVPRSQAFNKVGHAVHDLHPTFESFAYSDVIKTICKQIFMMQKPTIAQGMYIFKNKEVGGKYNPHKDGSFMVTQPQSVCGIWVSLDDATL